MTKLTKKDVKVGATYLMKHTSGLIEVRILEKVEYEGNKYRRAATHWRALNLKTNHEVRIKSAVKLIREITPKATIDINGIKLTHERGSGLIPKVWDADNTELVRIGVVKNNWRQRNVIVFRLSETEVVTYGIPFETGDPIICIEPISRFQTAISLFPKHEVIN